MADDKRQLVLDLLARAKTRQGTEEAANDLDKLARSAEEADKKTEGLGKSSEETGKRTDKLGNSLEDTERRIAKVDDTIGNLKKELSGMAAAFADAEDASEKADLGKAIRRTQNELRQNVKQRSVLADLLPDDQEVEKEVQRVQKKVGTLWEGVGEAATPALIAGAVAAAPAIGAVISGAVVGGTGIAGIAGGFLIASKDPRVKAAASAMKDSVASELKTAALPFTQVSIDAIGKFGRAFKGINFQQLFADAAKQAGPLIDGVTDLISKLGGAVVDLVHESGPEVAAIGKGISQIGSALANGLRQLGDNADANADALKNLFTVISLGISSVFGLIDGLTKLYDLGRRFSGGGLVDSMQAISDASTPVAGKVKEIADASVEAVTKTNDLAKAQNDEARAATGQRDALAAVAKELRAQTDPAFAVLDAMDKVRDAQTDAANATHKYGSNSEQARAASRKLAEAAIDLQGDVGALGESFDGNLTPTMRRTLSAAGLTKKQIQQVEAELRRAKHAADAYEGTYVAEIITNYTYNVGGNDYNREANRGSFSKRAAGGPIVRGMPYLVGENGPEIVVPDAGGRVLSAGASRGLMVQGAMSGLRANGGGGGSVRAVELMVNGSDQRLVSLLKYLIRTANVIEG